MMKLYHVETIVPEFGGHREVCLSWFVDRRVVSANRPYAELINDYDPDDEYNCYPEGAIYELFSGDEAQAFVAWLKQNVGETDETTKISEVTLPIEGNIMGTGAIPIGGPQGFLKMKEVSGSEPAASPLGFTVLGYLDLRAHEPIDKSVPARHQFCSIYIIDGKTITEYAELLELWRAGKIVAEDEANVNYP
jgi:hypothetical protein